MPEKIVLPIWTLLETAERPVTDLAKAADLSPGWAIIVVGALAKMGLVVVGG